MAKLSKEAARRDRRVDKEARKAARKDAPTDDVIVDHFAYGRGVDERTGAQNPPKGPDAPPVQQH